MDNSTSSCENHCIIYLKTTTGETIRSCERCQHWDLVLPRVQYYHQECARCRDGYMSPEPESTGIHYCRGCHQRW